MKPAAWISAICLGYSMCSGVAVSIHAIVRGLHAGVGNSVVGASSDDSSSDDKLATLLSFSNFTTGFEGSGAGNSSVVAPAQLADLLNIINEAQGQHFASTWGSLKTDPSQLTSVTQKLSVVGDLLSQLIAANKKTQLSLTTDSAYMGTCPTPTFLDPEKRITGKWTKHWKKVEEYHKCKADAKIIKGNLHSAKEGRLAALLARNVQCKVTAEVTPQPDQCNPNSEETYELWIVRQQAYYKSMGQKIRHQKSECFKQNQIYEDWDQNWKALESAHKEKQKQCLALEVPAKASECSLIKTSTAECEADKQCYNSRYTAYMNTEKVARIDLVEQKLDWDLLSRANCLSTAIDESTGEISAAKLEACTKVLSYNTSHLNLTYPDLPSPLDCKIPQKVIDLGKDCWRYVQIKQTDLLPFHRYWDVRTHNHVYETNWNHRKDGSGKYRYEGVIGSLSKTKGEGNTRLYRYWNAHVKEHFFTTNADEIGTTQVGKVGKHNYRCETSPGYCWTKQYDNTHPLHRGYSPTTHDHMLSTSKHEITSLGYTYEGVQCYIWTPEPAPTPFYRYWNAHVKNHFYTTNYAELGHGKHGYILETSPGKLSSTPSVGTVALYRYYKAGDHFYTTNVDEIKETIKGKLGAHGYKCEGIAGYCWREQVAGTTALYRYWNPVIKDHFYTSNWDELKEGRSNYKLESTQCYILK